MNDCTVLPPLPIETESLVLRRFVPEDVGPLFRMSEEEGMKTWIPSQVYRDEAHAAAVLRYLISCYDSPGNPEAGPVVLGVRLRASGELIGHVGFSPLDGAVEVGYAIASAHQGRGFATQAVAAASRWAKSGFSVLTLVGVTAAGNIGSHKVLLRAGYARVREGPMCMQGVMQPVVVFEYGP